MYVDNAGVLAALEERPRGLLPLLDEELRMPRGGEVSFVSKLVKAQPAGQGAYIKAARPGRMQAGDTRLIFTVSHFAGEVKYCAARWLEHSHDAVPETIMAIVLNR